MDESCYRFNPCDDPFAMMRGLCYRHAYELEHALETDRPCPRSSSDYYRMGCTLPAGHNGECDVQLLPLR